MAGSRSVDPNLQALRLLTALASEVSLGRAASAIGISQPYASRLIDRLEADHNLLLVRRTHTGTSLTQDGQLVAEWAIETMAAIDRLAAGLDALRAKHAEHLRITSSLTLAESLVPPLLSSFRVQQPGVQLSLRVQNSAEVVDEVLQGDLDVGFIEAPGPVPDSLGTLPVGADHLVVIAPAGHPWNQARAPISLRELAQTPLVMREDGSGTRLMYYHLLRGRTITPVEPFMVVSSNAAVRSAVAGGIAPGVLSVLAVHQHDSTLYHQVATDPLLNQPRPLRMIWSRAREDELAVHLFIKHVRTFRDRAAPAAPPGGLA